MRDSRRPADARQQIANRGYERTLADEFDPAVYVFLRAPLARLSSKVRIMKGMSGCCL